MTEKTSDDSTPEVNKEEELDDEALFGDIGGLFGDPQNCHGDMQHPFVYVWPKPLDDDDISLYTNPPPGKKEIELSLPDTDSMELMAHHVWEAAIQMSNLIARGVINVKGKRVLELGAGAALPSIISSFCGSKMTVVTDYNESAIVENMKKNLAKHVSLDRDDVGVFGYTWGESPDDVLCCNDDARFDAILLADTLWLGDQHESLLTACDTFLKRDGGTIYLTYQHHNDKAPIFFDLATSDKWGYEIVSSTKIPWGGRTLEEFDEDDGEAYGPVNLRLMRKKNI